MTEVEHLAMVNGTFRRVIIELSVKQVKVSIMKLVSHLRSSYQRTFIVVFSM